MNEDFNNLMQQLSENARLAIQKADLFSKLYNKGYVGTEHLLMGIASQDTSTGAKILATEGVGIDELKDLLGIPSGEMPSSEMAMMSLSEPVVLSLRVAQDFARREGEDTIGTEHLLYALITKRTSRATQMLRKLNVDGKAIIREIERTINERAEAMEMKNKQAEFSHDSQLKWLKRFGRDLTEQARKGELDTVVGREAEIERAITVLCRRTKSNPVLIGDAGVGKTAIVEGLAERIAKHDVPSFLIGKRIYQVDLSTLVAGTKFRGDFEERIRGVVKEASSEPSVILFIDELHLLTGAGGGSDGAMDAANILKPALARQKFRLIGATTSDEYRRYIEKDKALARRFQTVMVNEPSLGVTLRILKGIKKHYEKHHGVLIPDDLLETAINMSTRYINDRALPDKVIDVIDEACAITKVAADKAGDSKYKKLKIEASRLGEKVEQAAAKQDYKKAADFKTEQAKIEKEIKQLEKAGAKAEDQPQPTLTEADLAKAISLKTGIPVSKVHGSELSLLTNLEKHLKKSIIGQDEAVRAVAKAIRRGRSGIADERRPIGSFLFMGPTGVGKTELARVIAREVFGGDNSLIKIDMSEFGEKHNVSRLIGAPAGYVGYDDGGKLTEAVRRHPYSVVLFDEIEKAHPDVFNILLQILEDGALTDGQGDKVRFNNTVVILTSNLGSGDMSRESEFGFVAKTKRDRAALTAEHEHNKETAMRALKKTMRPELINRLDAILVFHGLTAADVDQIFDNLAAELQKRLAHQSIGLRIKPSAKKLLIQQGFDPKHGARPLRRTIEDQLESPIADLIIQSQIAAGQIVVATADRGKIKLEVVNE